MQCAMTAPLYSNLDDTMRPCLKKEKWYREAKARGLLEARTREREKERQ